MKARQALAAVGVAYLSLWLPQGARAQDPLEEVRQQVEAGQQAQALAALETLLAENPSSSDALLLHGVLLAEAGRIGEAKGEFQRLVDLHPGLPEAHNNLAVMLAAEGDYEAALDSLKGALGTSVSYRIAYENLTRIFAQLASEAYGRALEIDTPDRQQVGLVLLGKLSSGTEDRMAPAETLKIAAVEAGPDAAPALQSADMVESAAAAGLEPAEPLVEEVKEVKEVEETLAPVDQMAPIEPAEPMVASSDTSEVFETPESSEAADVGMTTSEAADGEVAAIEEEMLEDTAEETSPGDLTSRIEAWASAWSEQRVDDYLSFYAEDFQPADGMSRDEWSEIRSARVAAPDYINVGIAILDAEFVEPERAVVMFMQSYESDSFNDQVTKTLELGLEGGEWKILRETTEP